MPQIHSLCDLGCITKFDKINKFVVFEIFTFVSGKL